MKQFVILCIAVVGTLVAGCAPQPVSEDTVIAPDPELTSLIGMGTGSELITVTSPLVGSTISSPVLLQGEVPGYWYFEATAPVQVVDSNDVILGDGYVTAQGEWMTEDLVPFSGSVSYSLSGSTATTGSVILRRNNASGLPENDAYVSIPVNF